MRSLWAVISPMVSEKTRQSVRILGSLDDLRDELGAAAMPARMGGIDRWEYDAQRDTPHPPPGE